MKGVKIMAKKKVEENMEVMNVPTEPSKEVVNAYKKDIALIKRELGKVESSTLNIALAVHHIYRTKSYELVDYKNICELAKDMFGFSKSTCYNFINIVEKFGCEKDGVWGIDEQYKKFTYSQLLALIDVDAQKISLFSSDMSVRDIKSKVKELGCSENSKRLENETDDGEQAVLSADGSEVVIPSQEVKNVLISCRGLDDYNKKVDDIDRLILNMFNKSKKNVRIEIVAVEY